MVKKLRNCIKTEKYYVKIEFFSKKIWSVEKYAVYLPTEINSRMKQDNVNIPRPSLAQRNIFLAGAFLGSMTQARAITLERASGKALVSVLFASVVIGISVFNLSQAPATSLVLVSACLAVMCRMAMCCMASPAV